MKRKKFRFPRILFKQAIITSWKASVLYRSIRAIAYCFDAHDYFAYPPKCRRTRLWNGDQNKIVYIEKWPCNITEHLIWSPSDCKQAITNYEVKALRVAVRDIISTPPQLCKILHSAIMVHESAEDSGNGGDEREPKVIWRAQACKPNSMITGFVDSKTSEPS